MSMFDAASFWKDFRHGTAAVDGVRLHYVEGGSGRKSDRMSGRLQRVSGRILILTASPLIFPGIIINEPVW